MIIRSLQAGALISLVKPLDVFSGNDPDNILTGNALRFPPVFTNGGSMTLANSVVNVWPGQNTNVITVNGSYPCPSVVIQKGDTFTAHFINQLNEPATSHWHGISAPELMDGHPKDAILPGESRTYTFPVLNRAGTYFYHAHADMLTSKHVYKGFAGFFIVDDPAEISLGLPRGAYDIPLCLQDRRIADIPEFNYAPVLTDMTRGYLGDTVLVNGTPDAYFEVSKTLYRFRLLNGSNARVYKIAMSDNSPFQIIATDGGLKDIAVQANSFFLSPGERVDILFDFSSYTIGQSLTLKSLPFASSGGGIYRQGVEMNLMRFDVTGNLSSGGVVPSALTPISYYDPNDAVTVRDFVLSMVGGGMNMHRINGSTLLAPNDKGWKDTVLVNPSETVRVLVKFTDYAGIYLFHCHNLEHEDDGMMLNFKLTDNPIPVELTSFIYTVNNSNVTLNWFTASEINSRGFEIERIRTDNENKNEWKSIGFVKGNGTTSSVSDYLFTDKNLSTGNYKYRLKQIDYNGSFRYYSLQDEVVIGIPGDFSLMQNYPNPFNPSTVIGYRLAAGSFVTLKVYDMAGKEAAVLVNEFRNAGYYKTEFNGINLPSGTYIYRLEAGKIVSQKKMTLIK